MLVDLDWFSPEGSVTKTSLEFTVDMAVFWPVTACVRRIMPESGQVQDQQVLSRDAMQIFRYKKISRCRIGLFIQKHLMCVNNPVSASVYVHVHAVRFLQPIVQLF